MSATTYYVALPFQRTAAGDLVPAEARQAPTAWAAQLLALRFAQAMAGGVAFSRRGDMDTGKYDDAVVIGSYGAVPSDLRAP